MLFRFFHQLEVVDMAGRYDRNLGTLTEAEGLMLREKTICVIGCGGLGGYLIEMLARLGVGKLIAVDGDVFEVTNLNRQLLSDMQSLGCWKAEAAVQRVNSINPEVQISAVCERLVETNAVQILQGADLVMDALDNIESRLLLEQQCEALGLTLVHGAIGGWYGQVSVVMPGDRTLSMLYKDKAMKGLEKTLGNPAFTPAMVASIQVSEAIKLLIGRGDGLRGKVMLVDLFYNDFEVVELLHC